MTSEWLQNICNILRTTDVPQSYGDLIKFKDTYDEYGEVLESKFIGKCALGVISCEVGIPLSSNQREVSYTKILEKAGVPQELIESNLPYIRVDFSFTDITPDDDERNIDGIEFCGDGDGGYAHSGFSEYIFRLNDGGLTFNEIADFLEVTFGDY